MKRYVILLFLLSFAAAVRAASPKPTPMYIVNGKEMKEIRSIPPEDIENVELLPADEETIARIRDSTSRPTSKARWRTSISTCSKSRWPTIRWTW